MSKFFEELTFYDETDFKGKKKSVPPWVFENCYKGKKVLSVKIPDGVYLTLFKGGTAEKLVTDQSVTYTSDTADISSFSTTITGYIVQTNTIKSTFPLSSTTSYPATLTDNFLDYHAFFTFKEGTTDSLNITTAIGLLTGDNIVTLTDELNKDFTFYGNVIYLPAYLKVIKKASVVPLPVIKAPPVSNGTVPPPASSVTNGTVTTDKSTAVKTSKKSSNTMYYIVVSIVVFLLLLILIYILNKKKKRPSVLR